MPRVSVDTERDLSAWSRRGFRLDGVYEWQYGSHGNPGHSYEVQFNSGEKDEVAVVYNVSDGTLHLFEDDTGCLSMHKRTLARELALVIFAVTVSPPEPSVD